MVPERRILSKIIGAVQTADGNYKPQRSLLECGKNFSDYAEEEGDVSGKFIQNEQNWMH